MTGQCERCGDAEHVAGQCHRCNCGQDEIIYLRGTLVEINRHIHDRSMWRQNECRRVMPVNTGWRE